MDTSVIPQVSHVPESLSENPFPLTIPSSPLTWGHLSGTKFVRLSQCRVSQLKAKPAFLLSRLFQLVDDSVCGVSSILDTESESICYLTYLDEGGEAVGERLVNFFSRAIKVANKVKQI